MKNILFSATRQWNPGDEFILLGVMNILKKAGLNDFNPILYNRNPDICSNYNIFSSELKKRMIDWCRRIPRYGYSVLEYTNIEHHDNSFKYYDKNSFIDMCVIAGSPEWYQDRLNPLYNYIYKNNIPILFLGIGLAGNESLGNIIKKTKGVIKDASLITTRDSYTQELLNDIGAVYIPCPALQSSPTENLVNNVDKIGLIYGTDKSINNNKVSREAHQFLYQLYKKLSKIYKCEIVCHYIDEIEEAKKEFPNLDIRYSYDSKDYLDIYNNYQFVIGPRIHGIGLAASMGIPGVVIKHDKRGDTANGFGARIINYKECSVDDTINVVATCIEKIEQLSSNCIKIKHDAMIKYISLLSASKCWQSIE